MGRQLKRVPLDFSWPVGMVWKGYLNPYHAQKCKPCDGSGQNPETHQIAEDFYDFAETGRRWVDAITQDEADALVAAGRCRQYVGGEEVWRSVPRTAEEINAANRRGSSMVGDMSHDGINRWILVETRAKRLGVFGSCTHCGGEGQIWATDEVRRQSEAWEDFDPPTGDGFQLWENTSEGSPVSPVFASLDALCAWAADNATTFGSAKASAEDWRKMLDDGHVYHQKGSAVFL